MTTPRRQRNSSTNSRADVVWRLALVSRSPQGDTEARSARQRAHLRSRCPQHESTRRKECELHNRLALPITISELGLAFDPCIASDPTERTSVVNGSPFEPLTAELWLGAHQEIGASCLLTRILQARPYAPARRAPTLFQVGRPRQRWKRRCSYNRPACVMRFTDRHGMRRTLDLPSFIRRCSNRPLDGSLASQGPRTPGQCSDAVALATMCQPEPAPWRGAHPAGVSLQGRSDPRPNLIVMPVV